MTSQLRYRRPKRLRWIGFAVLVAWGGYRFAVVQQGTISERPDFEDVKVLRVIDGDTLLVEGDRRVRLLGVNTPETKHPDLPPQPFGTEATEFTKHFVQGKTVRLVFDRERFDDYQRTLAFVYVAEHSLNVALVLAGLATAETQYPFRSDMKKKLVAAEKEAKQKRIGIWSLHPIP